MSERLTPDVEVLMTPNLRARVLAEFLGTAFLLVAVVGSGIMGERLSGGNVALSLLANSVATGAALVALILTFGPTSGAHFNPLVTLLAVWRGEHGARVALAYVGAQLAGAFLGVAVTHAMFGEALFSASTHVRSGAAQLLSELVATLGLLLVVRLARRGTAPFAVAAYITGAYWFTASTAFANPAVTLARACSNSFAGIRPVDAPGFVLAEVAGALVAAAVLSVLLPASPRPSDPSRSPASRSSRP